MRRVRPPGMSSGAWTRCTRGIGLDLVEILTRLTADEGLSVALIAGRDGLLIEGQAHGSAADLDSLAALATRALPELERLGRAIAGGNLSQVRLRYDGYLLLIELLSPTDVLIVGMQGTGGSERLFDGVARHRLQLQQALSAL